MTIKKPNYSEFNNIDNYRRLFEPLDVDIPKQAPLISRIYDRFIRFLPSSVKLCLGIEQSNLSNRALNLQEIVCQLMQPGDTNHEGMKLFNIRAAEFLNDFRSRVGEINTANANERFGQALHIFNDSLAKVKSLDMTSNDKCRYYQSIVMTLRNEFFDFVAECYKYEVVITGTFSNIEHVHKCIFRVMAIEDIPNFETIEDVKQRFQFHVVRQLPSIDELVQHKTELILKKDPTVRKQIKALNRQIKKLMDDKQALTISDENSANTGLVKNLKMETSLIERQLRALRRQRGELLDELQVSTQINEYRLNLVSIGVLIDPKSVHHEQLTALAKKNGYTSYTDMLNQELGRSEQVAGHSQIQSHLKASECAFSDNETTEELLAGVEALWETVEEKLQSTNAK